VFLQLRAHIQAQVKLRKVKAPARPYVVKVTNARGLTLAPVRGCAVVAGEASPSRAFKAPRP